MESINNAHLAHVEDTHVFQSASNDTLDDDIISFHLLARMEEGMGSSRSVTNQIRDLPKRHVSVLHQNFDDLNANVLLDLLLVDGLDRCKNLENQRTNNVRKRIRNAR